jgi:plastocyanin
MATLALRGDRKHRTAGRIVVALAVVGLIGTVGFIGGREWWRAQQLEQQQAAMDGPPHVGLNMIGMNELAYTAPHVEVAAGTIVTWTNDEDNEHDVLFIDGTPGSPLLAAGERWSMMFDQPGSYQYVCSLHPFMVGKVTVTQ